MGCTLAQTIQLGLDDWTSFLPCSKNCKSMLLIRTWRVVTKKCFPNKSPDRPTTSIEYVPAAEIYFFCSRLQGPRFAPLTASSPKICLNKVGIKIHFWENSAVFENCGEDADGTNSLDFRTSQTPNGTNATFKSPFVIFASLMLKASSWFLTHLQ